MDENKKVEVARAIIIILREHSLTFEEAYEVLGRVNEGLENLKLKAKI